MNNKINLTISAIFVSAISFHASSSHADGTLSLTTGADYSSGKYGQSKSTQMTYIPFIGKFENEDITLKLTVPWLQITGPGDVVGGNTPIVIGSSNRRTTTESGLGDIVLSATHTIAQLGETKPLLLDITGKIKFSTASASKGLGTGENDYTLELDAYKALTDSLTAFGDVGYKRLGDPSGVNLNNVWFTAAGLSYKFLPSTSAGIMADYRQATLDTSQPVRELTIFVSHKFNDDYKLQSYLSQGYSDSSADWGGGLMLGRSF